MKINVPVYLLLVFLMFFGDTFVAYAQVPATGTVTFQYASGANQVVGSSAYACFVPTTAAGYTNDTGVGFDFVAQGTGENNSNYLQVGFYTFSGNDAMLYFNRSTSSVTVAAAYIMSAATGAASSQTATSLPAAGGEFQLTSIDLEAVSVASTVTIQAYRNGVAIGTAVTTPTLSTTAKTTISLASNANFADIDEIAIKGFNGDGIRVDNIVTAATPPVITTQPVSQTVCNSSLSTFSVAATGTGLTYQWYENGTILQTDHSDGNGSYTGSQTATLNMTAGPGTFFNGVTFTCVVTSTNGTSTTSSGATLTMEPLPNATFTAPAQVYVGIAATFTVAMPIDGNTYSYVYGAADGVISVTNTSSFQVTFPTIGDKMIYLTVTNKATGCSAYYSLTVVATLNVNSAGYAFSQPITIKSSAINVGSSGISTTLTNFPVLVYIKEDALSNKYASNCANNVQNPGGGTTNGFDFAFTLQGSQQELFYQVESFDAANGILMAWVQVPSLTSTDLPLTFYFGASTPGHTAAFAEATWNTDYQAVYHLNEGTGTSILDATTNARNGTGNKLTTATGEIQLAAGLTNGAYLFNGVTTSNTLSSSVIQSAGTTTSVTGTFTLSAWVNAIANSSDLDQKIVTNESDFSAGYAMSINGTSTSAENVETETRSPQEIYNNGTVSTIALPTSTPAWHYIQSVYDGTNFLNYVDGVLKGSAAGTAPDASSTNIVIGQDYIGSSSAPQHDFYGMLNEVRISNAAKTADWIKAEYWNQTNPTTFTYANTTITTYTANKYLTLGASVVYVWTGASSTSPTTAGNWAISSSATPTAASVAPPNDGTATLYIPNLGTTANYPTLTQNTSLFGLVLASGAKLNLSSYTLNVGCNIYNNSTGVGQLIGATGTVYGTINWAGTTTTPQYFYGSSTSTTNIGNMIVNNTQGSTVNITGGPLSIYNTLTMTKGSLAINNSGSGSLVLVSSATGSASVAAVATACTTCLITGNATVQRYFPGGTAAYRSYRLLTLPVNITSLTNQNGTEGFMDLSSLNAGLITAGPGAGFSYPTPTANPLMYLYDESRPQYFKTFLGGKNVGIYSLVGSTTYKDIYYPAGATAASVPTASAEIPIGNSVQVYYVGPYPTTGSPTLTATIPAAATTSATGYLNQGTIPIYIFSTASKTLSYSPSINTLPVQGLGLNQVGNPYPSTIDLDSLYYDNKSSGTNIGPIFWELKEPNNTFVAYSASHTASSAGAEAYIASGQGFYVQAISTSSTLTFYEKEKVSVNLGTSTSPVLIFNQNTNSSIPAAEILPTGLAGLHLQILKDTATYTQTGIYFNPAWSDAYSPTEDAIDLDGISPKVYLSSYSSDNTRLCINQLGDYSKGKTVKLYVAAITNGTYNLSLADVKNIDAIYSIYLRDHQLNDSVDLRTTNNYSFAINNSDTTSFGANRFDLVIAMKTLPPYQLLSFTGQKAPQGVQLNWNANNTGTYTSFALQKEQINGTYTSIYTVQSNNSTSYTYIDPNPVIGNNTYRLAQNDLLGNTTYSQSVTIGYSSVSSNGYFSVYPNPATDIINVIVNSTSAANYTADIYNTSGMLMDHRTLNTDLWTEDVSNYKEGVYIITLKNTNGDILAKSKFIKTK